MGLGEGDRRGDSLTSNCVGGRGLKGTGKVIHLFQTAFSF